MHVEAKWKLQFYIQALWHFADCDLNFQFQPTLKIVTPTTTAMTFFGLWAPPPTKKTLITSYTDRLQATSGHLLMFVCKYCTYMYLRKCEQDFIPDPYAP